MSEETDYVYPNLSGLTDGRVSGRLSEWPMLKVEAKNALAHIDRLCAELAQTKAELKEANRINGAKRMSEYRTGKTLGTTIYLVGENEPCAWVPNNPDLADHIVTMLNCTDAQRLESLGAELAQTKAELRQLATLCGWSSMQSRPPECFLQDAIAELQRAQESIEHVAKAAPAEVVLEQKEELAKLRSENELWQSSYNELLSDRDRSHTELKEALAQNRDKDAEIARLREESDNYTRHLATAARELARLRRVIKEAPHGCCSIQSGPHCAVCHGPKSYHFGNKFTPDGACKDGRGRPSGGTYTEKPPLPCDCWKSRVSPEPTK